MKMIPAPRRRRQMRVQIAVYSVCTTVQLGNVLVRARKLRKRRLPASPGGRRRTRHNVTLGDETLRKLARRQAAARAIGYRTSLSAEIDRAVDEAEGNLRTARHQLGNALNPLRVHLGFLKSELLCGRGVSIEDLKPIEDAVAKMAARLEPPATSLPHHSSSSG